MTEVHRLYHATLAGCLVLTYLSFFPQVVTGILYSEPDLPEVVTHTQSWGALQINRSVSETPLSIQGRRYWRGFGTHANSIIQVRIPERAKTFIGACGIDDQGHQKGQFTCAIRKNGQIVWETQPVTQYSPFHPFRLSVSSLDVLELLVIEGARGIDYAHANWVDLQFDER